MTTGEGGGNSPPAAGGGLARPTLGTLRARPGTRNAAHTTDGVDDRHTQPTRGVRCAGTSSATHLPAFSCELPHDRRVVLALLEEHAGAAQHTYTVRAEVQTGEAPHRLTHVATNTTLLAAQGGRAGAARSGPTATHRLRIGVGRRANLVDCRYSVTTHPTIGYVPTIKLLIARERAFVVCCNCVSERCV